MITLICWLVSVTALALVALLGPSAAVPAIPGGGGWPPYWMSAAPAAGTVIAIEIMGLAAGAVALWRLQTAARQERGPDPRRLQTAGFLAAAGLTLLPPAGSSDVLNYVAYGQEAVSGVNPYLLGPQSAGVPQNAITAAVGTPWQFTPSVYGPAFTRISTVIAHLAHGDGHVAVTLTRLVITAAFVGTGILLASLCRTDAGRRRAVVMWGANPLLLYTLVAGAHVDALIAFAGVCALTLVRRSPLAAGLLAGVAGAVKLNGLVVLPGLVWAVRDRRRAAAAVAIAACAVVLPWYLATTGVFGQLHHVSQFTTPASPWRAVRWLMQPLLGVPTARSAVVLGAAAVGLVVIVLLFRRGLPPPAGETTVDRAAAVTATFAVGWVLTAPYVLPWYDAIAWAPLALVGASFLDRVLVLHTTALAFALLPGEDIPLPTAVHLTSSAFHSLVSPIVLAVLLLVTVRVVTRRAGETEALQDWGR